MAHYLRRRATGDEAMIKATVSKDRKKAAA